MINIYIAPQNIIPAFVAGRLRQQLIQKPNSVLGLATGGTPLILYRELADQFTGGKISFADAISFNLDEYIGLDSEHEQSYRYYMNEHLFRHIDIKLENTHLPDGMAVNLEEECLRYDRAIEDAGGIDWQLLGIGLNGHIGFNEPGEFLVAHTHVEKLLEDTRRANERFFSSQDEVPTHAISLGIGGILKAKKIIMLAFGQEKANIIYQALCGPVTTLVPASLLQLHSDVTVLLDEQSAALITEHGGKNRVKVLTNADVAVNL